MNKGRTLGLGIGLGLGLGSAFSGFPTKTLNITIKTDNTGTSTDTQFELLLDGSSTYNFDVDWGDGNSETVTTNTPITHEYGVGNEGTYTIKIGGTNNTFPTISYNNGGDRLKVLDLQNWGNIVWASKSQSWRGCSNMLESAMDDPDVALVSSFGGAFNNTGFVTFSLGGWDCTGSNNFEGTFRQMLDLTSLDFTGGTLTTITNVKRLIQDSPLLTTITGFTSAGMAPINMQSFAQGATLYNQDLSGLDFSAVTLGSNALLNSAFSTANWDLLIVSLAAQTLQSGVVFHAGSANYTEGAVDSGTADGTTASKLIDSTQNFVTTVSVNDILHNTTDDTYAKVTAVDSNTALSLSADIMISTETYVVQGSAVAKDRFSLITDDLWVLTDGGPV